MPEPGDSPVMDGYLFAPKPLGVDIHAIILSGVSDITIMNLEIKNYTGNFVFPEDPNDDNSAAIIASGASSSDIKIHNDYLHDNGHGVLARSSGTDWEIKNNEISRHIDSGIWLRNVSNVRIEGSTVSDSGTGILVGDRIRNVPGDVLAENVSVEGNEIFNTGVGILIRARVSGATGTARLTKVRVEENSVHDNGRGIQVEARELGDTLDSSQVEINIVFDNQGDGILLRARGPSNLTNIFVSTNTLVDNGRKGILLQAGGGSMGGTISQVHVENDTVNGSGQAGIFLSTEDVVTAAVTGNTLENNLLSDNGDGGIGLNVEEGTIAGNVITGNEATNNNNNGFSANTGAGVNNFQDNRSSLNTGFGYLDTGLANIYSGNLCDFNGSGGSSPEGLCTP